MPENPPIEESRDQSRLEAVQCPYCDEVTMPNLMGGALGSVGPDIEGVVRSVPVIRGAAQTLVRHRGCCPPGRARGATETRGKPQGFPRAPGQAGRGGGTPPASASR